MAEKKSENAKAAAKKTAKKPNVFKRLAKYLGSCKSEIKKITWPTPLVRSRWSFYEHNRLIRI